MRKSLKELETSSGTLSAYSSGMQARQINILRHAERTAHTDLNDAGDLYADLDGMGEEAFGTDPVVAEVTAEFGEFTPAEVDLWVTHYNDVVRNAIEEA